MKFLKTIKHLNIQYSKDMFYVKDCEGFFILVYFTQGSGIRIRFRKMLFADLDP